MKPIRTVFSFLTALYWAYIPQAHAADMSGQSAHDFVFPAIDGGELPLEQYSGKAVLVVNVASQCGFTPQYKGLQELTEMYGSRGLVVLGVPSNDFGGQEPGGNDQIKAFATQEFQVTFPMTAKQRVVGKEAHPFYHWAKAEIGSSPLWNFHKYLVAPDGRVVDYFSSFTSPTSDSVKAAIEQHLPEG